MSRVLADVIALHDRIVEHGGKAEIRAAALIDLFFLMRVVCGRRDLEQQWLLDRCDEVLASPDGHLDLWARDHYKSSLITFGKTLQDILADPELTVGIFSHTRPAAKAFLKQIKRELEGNPYLRWLFDDVVWADPFKQAPGWSEDAGLILKRKSNPKEATLEAWGLVDGQPTGKHFMLRVYDDVVTFDSSRSEEMRISTLAAWELSLNLATADGRERYIGTRYHFADVYQTMIDRGAAHPRIWPAVDDAGKPYLLSPQLLANKRKRMGPVTFAAQMLLNPLAGGQVHFRREWLRFYKEPRSIKGNVYILVDPANSKKKYSDYTVAMVVCLCADRNYYVLDMVRDRLSLGERWRMLAGLHRLWQPRRVYYEQYGKEADIEHFKHMMQSENYRFELYEMGGVRQSKNDRIEGLIPEFEQSKIYLPDSLTRMVEASGQPEDLVKWFVDGEFACWPYSAHDDMLDCLARVTDVKVELAWPKEGAVGWFGSRAPAVQYAVGTGEVRM
jgi:phage terminase large subunit-like protein